MGIRTRLARRLALGAATATLAFAPFAGPACADPDPGSTATPSSELRFGATPVDGCPRFFIRFSEADVDRCADALEKAGWGLSAVRFNAPASTELHIDAMDGAFEPHTPKRWVVSGADDVKTYDAKTVSIFDTFDGGDRVVTEYQRGAARACDDLLLHEQYYFSVPDERAYFIRRMSEYAARGCVPGSAFSFVSYNAPMQEDATEYVAFVPGDPHARVASWAKTGAERLAFETRARARGFRRLAIATVPDRFGVTAGARYEQKIGLGNTLSQSRRYESLEAELSAAWKRGERVVDLDVRDSSDGDTLMLLWESAPAP